MLLQQLFKQCIEAMMTNSFSSYYQKHNRYKVILFYSLILLSIVLLVRGAEPSFSFPTFEDLDSKSLTVRLLPGCHEFIFSMYGTPGDITQLKQLVTVMQESHLGNGFDPAPAARSESKPLLDYIASLGWPVICYPGYADMQVMGGKCRLSDDDMASLSEFDRRGLFSAVQLGEWGYYFHNLSSDDSWWRSVYGDEYDRFKHLKKPEGLKGYDRCPTSRRECYEIVKQYYLSRNKDMGGRSISVTGHSHYEAYAAEWGSSLIGLELGENIAFTQSKLAFARGAARQWKRPWSVQVSPWFAGSCTTNGPLRIDGQYARGLDAGHSLNFYWRMWLHAWFAGTAMVTPENSISSFFENAAEPWTLTSHGKKAAEFFEFTHKYDRGIPYTPVAIVLDWLSGYNAYQGKPWGILEPTEGDREISDLFQLQLFPGSDHIHQAPDPINPEMSYLRPTPYGELFDILLSSADADTLSAYPVLLLAGDIDFTPLFFDRIKTALQQGSRLMLHERHIQALGARLEELKQAGLVECLTPWINPESQRPAAISNDRLQEISSTFLPIAVSGDPIQYQVNRTKTGWVVELINNLGVIKRPDRPVEIDVSATAQVSIQPHIPIQSARIWGKEETLTIKDSIPFKIGPGEVVYVEFVSK